MNILITFDIFSIIFQILALWLITYKANLFIGHVPKGTYVLIIGFCLMMVRRFVSLTLNSGLDHQFGIEAPLLTLNFINVVISLLVSICFFVGLLFYIKDYKYYTDIWSVKLEKQKKELENAYDNLLNMRKDFNSLSCVNTDCPNRKKMLE